MRAAGETQGQSNSLKKQKIEKKWLDKAQDAFINDIGLKEESHPVFLPGGPQTNARSALKRVVARGICEFLVEAEYEP